MAAAAIGIDQLQHPDLADIGLDFNHGLTAVAGHRQLAEMFTDLSVRGLLGSGIELGKTLPPLGADRGWILQKGFVKVFYVARIGASQVG